MYNNRLDLYLLDLLQRCDPEDVDNIIDMYNKQSGNDKGTRYHYLNPVEKPRNRKELLCMSEEDLDASAHSFLKGYAKFMVDPKNWLRVDVWFDPNAKPVESRVESLATTYNAKAVSTKIDFKITMQP